MIYVDCKYGRDKKKLLDTYFLMCNITNKSLVMTVSFSKESDEVIGIPAEYYLSFKTILKRYAQNKLKEIPDFRFFYYNNNNEQVSEFAKTEKMKINKNYYLRFFFNLKEKNSTVYIYLSAINSEIIADYMQIKQKEVIR